MKAKQAKNYDARVVEDFGREWRRFDQAELSSEELEKEFNRYFKIFPWESLPEGAIGFDLGCGSGRWAKLAAEKVGKLYCIDASIEALKVARRNLNGADNCLFVNASVDGLPFADDSFDFGYSLGVLHHVPDTAAGIACCVAKLKPGAPFLIYLYYAFDNRPFWFRWLWRCTDALRRLVSKLPFEVKCWVTQGIACLIYYPLAKFALAMEKLGCKVDNLPLSGYRHRSFYFMKTDALDRFGTKIEKRYTATQIREMLEQAGLDRIAFSKDFPYWCAVGFKKNREEDC